MATNTPIPDSQVSPELAESAPDQSVERFGAEARDFLETFTQQFSPRESATEQEQAAAAYLAAILEEYGYDTHIQEFDVELIPRDSPVLSVLSPVEITVEGVPMSQTGLGSVTGEIVAIGKAMPNDLPSQGITGKIALIERGTITFQEKSRRAREAGAVGVVVYNSQSGLFRGSLTDRAEIPVVGISRESGLELLEVLQDESSVSAMLSVEVETRPSRNVIADKPGTEVDGGIVVLGGHYDTVADVPGANDNGSGIASLITLARDVAERDYPFAIRFIAFGSEELGFRGSAHYVRELSDQERDSTIAMLNFDALGTGPTPAIIASLDEVEELILRASERNIEVQRRFGITGGSSDHAPFQAAEIPFVFFMADDFSRIHTAEDRLEYVDEGLLGSAVALGLATLDILAAR